MKKVKILLISLILIVTGIFFSYINAEGADLSKTTKETLQLKFSKR